MSEASILVFSSKITNRVRFTFRLVFKELLGVPVRLVDDPDEFDHDPGPRKLSYARRPLGDEFNLTPHGLLFQRGLTTHEIRMGAWDDVPVFFGNSNEKVPFDLLAATFYLVARYEEYLPHKRDVYNRFDAKESLAYREGFLQIPLVNIWVNRLREVLAREFPDLTFKKRQYRFVPTIDVDNAYAFLGKGPIRTAGAFIRSLVAADFPDMRQRARVLMGKEHDPYDTFDHQLEIQQKYGLKPIYFFLVADYGVNDKNVPITSRRFQSLIKRMNDYADVGIHPSFASNREPEKLGLEINRLADVLHTDVTKSRQHFLKLHLPETYRRLIEREVTDDYSMGYAAELGFRASICDPYHFYDLDREVETRLRIHPFCVMEGTMRFYQETDPEEALERMRPIVEAVKAVDGTLMALWHNDSLSEHPPWKGWKGLYESFVQLALPDS